MVSIQSVEWFQEGVASILLTNTRGHIFVSPSSLLGTRLRRIFNKRGDNSSDLRVFVGTASPPESPFPGPGILAGYDGFEVR